MFKKYLILVIMLIEPALLGETKTFDYTCTNQSNAPVFRFLFSRDAHWKQIGYFNDYEAKAWLMLDGITLVEGTVYGEISDIKSIVHFSNNNIANEISAYIFEFEIGEINFAYGTITNVYETFQVKCTITI